VLDSTSYSDEHGNGLGTTIYAQAACMTVSAGYPEVYVGGDGPMSDFEHVLGSPRSSRAERAWELYETALRVEDEVAQFLALYSALYALIPSQRRLDDFIERTQGSRRGWPMSTDPRGPPRSQSPFTRIRNRFMHPVKNDPGDRWDHVANDARANLRALRAVVAAAIRNPPP